MANDGAGSIARRIGALELERITARGWPGLHTEWSDGWLLRAGGGWTGRANAALPVHGDGDLDRRLHRVTHWYREHGLAPLVQVPLPVCTALRDRLVERGWAMRWGALVMVADISDVVARAPRRDDLPPVTVAPAPDGAWLAAYHYRGGLLPAVAIEVLRAGAQPRFLSVVDDGAVVAICRTSVAEDWLGITAVEVAQTHRRRGLATHLLMAAIDHARSAGARHVYLQTERTNAAALALYARAGFMVHHDYAYHGPEPIP
ncbi:hypothetical protein BH23ACT10_BH23ACT10_22670 [soil metagenome]